MPLTSRFESLERSDYTKDYPLIIERGKAGYFEDKSIAGFIVAQCMALDNGGYVYLAEESKTSTESPIVIACTPQDLAEQILPGLSCNIEIINEDDEYGTLIIQHVMPGGWINSLN